MGYESGRFYWDVFISHAREDKAGVATPLANALRRFGIKVWIDEQQLTIGDSLRRKIDEGLARSRFGIVILSPSFFAKEWPKKELDGLVSRDDGQEKVILPIWHNVSKKDVALFSPILADKVAASTASGMDKVAAEIIRVILPQETEIQKRLGGYREIQYVDRVVTFLLRAEDVSTIVPLLMGADSPRTRLEYQSAINFVWGLIEECQPSFSNTKLDRPSAVKVIIGCPTPPFHLLAHWATFGVLSYALGNYATTFMGALTVQETACQFQDDIVLVAGAKYSFGLSAFCLRHNTSFAVKEWSPTSIARHCQGLLLGQENRTCVRTHSIEALELSSAFHELAFRLWECKYKPDGTVVNIVTDDMVEGVIRVAQYIDEATDYVFDLTVWSRAVCFQD